MAEGEQLVAAKCRACGKQLTVSEFRACSGLGHWCAAHVPAGRRPARPSAPSRSASAPAEGGRRNRRLNEAGAVEYPCKAQFAHDGSIRRGRLTCDHPACSDGLAVFVMNDIPYSATEIVALFIRDPDGKRIARHAGFQVRD